MLVMNELSSVDALVVVTQRAWLARELIQAAESRVPALPAVHNQGLDVPDLSSFRNPAWWVPAEHAARLVLSGVSLPLLTPGPLWLPRVGSELLGRNVWAGRVSQLDTCPFSSGFAKPAEAKVPTVEASWWADLGGFKELLSKEGAPADAFVQVSDTRLDIRGEYRVIVSGGRVLGVSAYLLDIAGEQVFGVEGLTSHPLSDVSGARGFAELVLDAVALFSPASFVLDVAQLKDGSWVALEANNTWSSNPYDVPGGVFVEALIEAVAPVEVSQVSPSRLSGPPVVSVKEPYGGPVPVSSMVFVPDAWLVSKASRMRVLPRRLA